MFLSLDGNTELARVFDVMMARAKIIYILMIKVNKLFSFFPSRCFLKEIENMFSVFLLSFSINLLAFYHAVISDWLRYSLSILIDSEKRSCARQRPLLGVFEVSAKKI